MSLAMFVFAVVWLLCACVRTFQGADAMPWLICSQVWIVGFMIVETLS